MKYFTKVSGGGGGNPLCREVIKEQCESIDVTVGALYMGTHAHMKSSIEIGSRKVR